MQARKAPATRQPLPPRRSPKKRTPVRIDDDLLQRARELGINPSETLEAALSDEIRQRQRDLWRKENREAIEAYNELVARDGVFSKGLRGF